MCDDCGAALEKKLTSLGAGISMWVFPPHECPEGEARKAREAEERQAAHREWLRNPPPARIAEIRARVQLPRYVPAGLNGIRMGEVDRGAMLAIEAHLEAWVAGDRPERGLWFFGPTDSRKTTMLGALLFDVAHRTGRRCLCWNLEHLMGQLRREARGDRSRYNPQAIEDADLLFLDDIGSVNVTEPVYRLVYDLVEAANACWGADGPTQTLYVTSNEDPDTLAALFSGAGGEGRGERIVRRLVQLCEPIAVGTGRVEDADIPAALRQKAESWGVR